ncbi:hypothetical protein [Kitasatospora sp. MBT63]|uniref:hypothetical protein n=1 Tax=Kitasatospora sp. MBT63 TaxID=1444768 RepID=UPI00053B8183|nr:hypothetical protein [Kitasatospora sp. MBT63]
MDMRAEVALLIDEAERQLNDGVWDLTPGDRALARQAAAELKGAVGGPDSEGHPADIDRLEHLREALAVLAIALSRTHGRLAWFLAGGSAALSPVLHWRALPAGDRPAFNTVRPTPQQYADAEDAVRRLGAMLTRLGT